MVRLSTGVSLFSLVLWASPSYGQVLSTHIYGGSGSDAINGVAVDGSGNIYAVGTTTSFDLLLLHPSQAANTGTQLVYSPDAGLTWKPLVNLPGPFNPYSEAIRLAVDPTNPAVVYAGKGSFVFKSTDGGRHFTPGVRLPAVGSQGFVSSLAIDPTEPSLLYATTLFTGTVYKSTDAGGTWNQVSGLPATGNYDTVVIDPFHPKSLWVWAGVGGYISTDGGDTWNVVPLPFQGNETGGIRFVFDAATPGTVYGPAQQNGPGLQKSTDGGKMWSPVAASFNSAGVVADPVRAGYLYAIDLPNFYRTKDGGASWQSFPLPALQTYVMPAIDPANPNVIVAGSYRSTDDGQTWSPTSLSRGVTAVFAPRGKGLVYASGPASSDIFLAKFAPDGKTLLFATYFGGMGNETASGIQIDGSGDVWVGGTTSSFDLPVSSNALETKLKGMTNGFLAKFTSEGQYLASTYLGGSAADTIKSFKVDGGGNVWMTGQTTSRDFPVTTGQSLPLPPNSANEFVFIVKTDPLASQLLYSAYVATSGLEQPGGLTIDPSGNVVLTGTTNSATFPVSPNVIHTNPTTNTNEPNVFLIKFDSSGKTIFSTYLGGTKGAATQMGGYYLDNIGVAIATDSSGIYLTGTTSATDFPTTAGADQTTLHGGCTYPAFAYDTGLIGTIYTYLVDDVFVTKLSPDARTLIYSTLLGGSCYDRPTDILVSPTGSVFVTGETDSIDFPLVHPVENGPTVEQYKSFVTMLNAGGSTVPFSTYLTAGSGPVLALGPDGVVHVGGSSGYLAQTATESGFPFPPGVPNTDGYLAALDLSGAPDALDLTEALNAFSLLAGPVAGGEIIKLTVPGFHPTQPVDIGLNERLALGTTLSGVQVLFDGRPVPLVRVSSGTIVCIAPEDFGTQQTTAIQVSAPGGTSNVLSATVAPSALGLLSADGSGQGLANARNDNGTLNSAANPAGRGSTITLYFTGAGGPLQPVMVNYGPAASVSTLNGFVPGIYAAYFQVPTDAGLGYPFSVSVNTSDSQSQMLTIYIH